MSTHTIGVLKRAVLYSFFSGIVAAIIYMIIDLVTGGKFAGNLLLGCLITGLISFVIAMLFFSGFMLYFSRSKVS